MSLLSTPFHARAVEANRSNVWENRRGYTLASRYKGAEEEALAARFGGVVGDLSWHWRAIFQGGDIEAFVARAFTRNGAALAVGQGTEVLWLNDGGAVRGRGILVRLSPQLFLLLSPEEDRDWLFFAAGLYGVSCAEEVAGGVLALIGPYAKKILAAAGITVELPPYSFRRLSWRGLDIALSRLRLGYELWCGADVSLIIWDRLQAAGRSFGMLPAGQTALDILAFEAGVLTAGRDFVPARDGFEQEPSPQSLGLSALIDPSRPFNGKKSVPAPLLSGLILEGEAPLGPVAHKGLNVGRLLATRYSPAVRAVLGLAVLDESCPQDELMAGHFACRSVGLPFLSIPVPEDSATDRDGASV